jgi:hypothetical protein
VSNDSRRGVFNDNKISPWRPLSAGALTKFVSSEVCGCLATLVYDDSKGCEEELVVTWVDRALSTHAGGEGELARVMG